MIDRGFKSTAPQVRYREGQAVSDGLQTSIARVEVRHGSDADIRPGSDRVRCDRESGHQTATGKCRLCAKSRPEMIKACFSKRLRCHGWVRRANQVLRQQGSSASDARSPANSRPHQSLQRPNRCWCQNRCPLDRTRHRPSLDEAP
jgi:hypothetical protein